MTLEFRRYTIGSSQPMRSQQLIDILAGELEDIRLQISRRLGFLRRSITLVAFSKCIHGNRSDTLVLRAQRNVLGLSKVAFTYTCSSISQQQQAMLQVEASLTPSTAYTQGITSASCRFNDGPIDLIASSHAYAIKHLLAKTLS